MFSEALKSLVGAVGCRGYTHNVDTIYGSIWYRVLLFEFKENKITPPLIPSMGFRIYKGLFLLNSFLNRESMP